MSNLGDQLGEPKRSAVSGGNCSGGVCRWQRSHVAANKQQQLTLMLYSAACACEGYIAKRSSWKTGNVNQRELLEKIPLLGITQ